VAVLLLEERPMRRGEKPAKAKFEAKRTARESRKGEGSKLRHLEARLAEALEREKATSEILRVIGASSTDVQPVFATVAETAARLCKASDASIFRRDGDRLRRVAHHGSIPAGVIGTYTLPLVRGSFAGRSVLDGRIVHVADGQMETNEFPEGSEQARRLGFRALLCLPLIREGVAIGVITLRDTEARLFSDRQIALLQTFADQAVIAIENVRLFTELQASNRDLTAALDTQTATSDILRVISSSQTDVQPVFDAILTSAVRLLQGYSGVATRVVSDHLELAALTRTTDTGDAAVRALYPERLDSQATHVRAVRDGAPFNVPDAWSDPRLPDVEHGRARIRGYRGHVVVPLLRQEKAIGTIGVTRREAGGFTEDEIALLQTFADQAVIAIENVRLFKELEAANRGLTAASQHKSAFLANMSHELRTPLNAIIGYSELLEEEAGDVGGGRLVPDLQKIAVAAKHQLSLINDILDLSKVEAGRMELEVTDFDLPGAIDNALTLVRERATRRGIALGRAVDDRVGMIQGDERKVKQVLLNVLSNALKFTPEGGRIDVGATVNEGLVEVSVTDTGVGIAPEDQETVFEEFRQVGTVDKKVEGTGLGLALSRRFIELHGGRISVKSELGHGSTFTFTIPRRDPID
jgi:signal transduction histidine kinase